jgi:hypothetical protein
MDQQPGNVKVVKVENTSVREPLTEQQQNMNTSMDRILTSEKPIGVSSNTGSSSQSSVSDASDGVLSREPSVSDSSDGVLSRESSVSESSSIAASSSSAASDSDSDSELESTSVTTSTDTIQQLSSDPLFLVLSQFFMSGEHNIADIFERISDHLAGIHNILKKTYKQTVSETKNKKKNK